MVQVHIDISKALPFVGQSNFDPMQEEAFRQHKILLSGSGKGNDHLGWLQLPSLATPGMISRIREDAGKFREQSELFVVIGIGGSYLGARAVIEALGHYFPDLEKNRKDPIMLYAGHNLSEDYHADLIKILDQYDYSVIVISKSGTTTEPAVAFRIIRAHMEKKYGKPGAAGRIIAITDASKGALKKLADEEGYSTYIIPDDVGGRYSVLTPVGLLPIAIAGCDIGKMLDGAKQMQEIVFETGDAGKNPAILYAAMRNALYRSGKMIEVMVSYRPGLHYFTEWWKQLYAESEGKENKGILPAGVSFTTDLHSLGQYLQEGCRTLFETILSVGQPKSDLQVPFDPNDTDGLNYLSGKRLSEINHMAEMGTLLAHVDGSVPCIRIGLPFVDEGVVGQLIYFFEFSCALSGYMLGVNPFDQPGVEAYKKNMFALLNKPGYEQAGKLLRERLK